MKWIACQTLIGGIAIGFENVIENKPEFIIYLTENKGNHSHLLNY